MKFLDIHFTLQEYRFATRSDASFGSIVGNIELNELPPGSPVDYSFVSTSRLSIDADGTVRTAQNMVGEETIDDIVLATQDVSNSYNSVNESGIFDI